MGAQSESNLVCRWIQSIAAGSNPPRSNVSLHQFLRSHALCCAPGASTRGHYAVVRKIFDVVQQVDHGAETEAAGLIPSAPTLRPADILITAACTGRAAALDVGVASPDASHAGADCLNTMYASKEEKYAPHRLELERQNIVYRPLVFSSFGRPHPEAAKFLKRLAQQVARRRCFVHASTIQRRLEQNIATEIWRRAARMVIACSPP